MTMVVKSMEMASGEIPHPVRLPKQRLSVPQISSAMVAALWNFSWMEADYSLSFRSGGILQAKRRREAVPEVGSPPPGAAWPRTRQGQVWPPLGSSPSLLLAPGVFWPFRISVIFPDFSEHFYFWTFSAIHRHNKQKLVLWHLVNKLVQ